MHKLRTFFCLTAALLFIVGCGNKDAQVETAEAASEEAHDHAGHDHDDHDHDHDHADHDHADHDKAQAGPVDTPIPAELAGDDPHAAEDHFIVSVNGKELKHSELNAMVQQMIGPQLGQIPAQMREQFMQQMMPRAQQQAIDRFIAGEVLSGEAQKQKLGASEEDVTARLGELRKQLPPAMAWEDALKQMGTTEAALREDVQRDIAIRALLDKHLATLPKATPEAIRAAYDANPDKYATQPNASARHILISFDEADDDAAKAAKLAEIKKLRKQIVDGGDFAELAKAHSTCPSKAKGGDLGTFGKGRMVPPFEKAAFSQDVNAVGEVVETRFGYHLIEVTARDEGGKKPFDAVKEQITEELSGESENVAVGEYITALRKDAKIVYGEGHAAPEPPAAP